MKLSEIRALEHLLAPHGGKVDDVIVQSWLDDSSRMSFAIPVSDTHLVVFLHQMDSSHCAIVLTTIDSQNVPVGYAVLIKKGDYWKVSDVRVDRELQGKGVGPELYRNLVAAGYKLQSGEILSQEAEKLWIKLGKSGRAKTLDAHTGKVYDFNDAPMNDKSLTPRWRWVMEAGYAPEWDQSPLFEGHPGLSRWLDGKIDATNCDIRWPGLNND
jgi:GNAT superfamily N-acetyltransferase